MRQTMILIAAAGLLAACDSNPPADDMTVEPDTASETMSPEGAEAGNVVRAMLMTADGEPAGEAILASTEGGLQLNLSLQGLPAGEHGVHIHQTGTCTAPDFKSAGGHWNPAGKQHGMENPQGAHMGDLPNVTIAEDGTGSLDYLVEGGTMDGENMLLDDDGAAFVVHAGPDDMKTDPAGDSGDRIACGVFEVRPSVATTPAE